MSSITRIFKCSVLHTKYFTCLRGSPRTFTSIKVFNLPNKVGGPRTVNLQCFTRRVSKKAKLEVVVDTKVAKDVLLYKCLKSRINLLLVTFGFAQSMFWFYMAHFVYVVLTPLNKKDDNGKTISYSQEEMNGELGKNNRLTIWQDFNILGAWKLRSAFVIAFITIGSAILCGSTLLSLRSVQYVILKKGGNAIEIVTSSPWFQLRSIKVPLSNVTCVYSRESCKRYHTVKVNGYFMKFFLDQTGTYFQPTLYDHTIGVKRDF